MSSTCLTCTAPIPRLEGVLAAEGRYCCPACIPKVRPSPPCVEIRDPEHGKVYIDRDGRAWTADSRRIPELDAAPALEPSMSAESVAATLAHEWRRFEQSRRNWAGQSPKSTNAKVSEGIRNGISHCATVLGPAVRAAFEREVAASEVRQ